MSRLEANSSVEAISIQDKVSFLRQPAVYPNKPGQIEVKETHMSWVFMSDQFVYKLKKPVRYDFLDFSTIEARRESCEQEVRLNRRLAPEIYLGTVALRLQDHGGLTLEGGGAIADWLVHMRRLPTDRMLDVAILDDKVTSSDVSRLSRLLTAFYQEIAAPIAMEPQVYRHRFEKDIASNFNELGKPEFGLSDSLLTQLAEAQRRFVANQGYLLEQRVKDKYIVEAHGDLRPEHICLLHEPVIIDCLEFNRKLRILDPVDELAYLSMECDRLNAPSIGVQVLQQYTDTTGDRAAKKLIDFYKAFRACVRAKIALWHTEDHELRDHDKWRDRANQYLVLAARYTL